MSTLAQFDALVGNRPHLESGIGFEPAARAAKLLLLDRLNDAIDAQNDLWRRADEANDALGLDPGVGVIEAEHVQPQNFHEGPHKSLVEAPPEAFPNVSVMAYMTVPSASQFGDQVDSSDITLFVESMAIAGPVPDGLETAYETIVHRRIQRMTEAVASVIGSDPTLLGTVHYMSLPPRGGVGQNAWLRREGRGAGSKHLWQGSRLQYTLTRHHATP